LFVVTADFGALFELVEGLVQAAFKAVGGTEIFATFNMAFEVLAPNGVFLVSQQCFFRHFKQSINNQLLTFIFENLPAYVFILIFLL
jgi:hypothetical protein